MNPFNAGKRFHFGTAVACDMSIDDTGWKIAKCDIMTGDYDFGLAEERMTLSIDSGMLIHNGTGYDKNSRPLGFGRNRLVEFQCKQAARILVAYG